MIVSELGVFLRKLRGGLSLREAAKKSGLSYTYIRSLELGKHPRTGAPINPTPDILRGLAKAYNYPHEELMRKAGYLDKEDSAEKLIEYMDVLELTDEEIYDRMTFKVDDMTLSKEEVLEFIAFVRYQRSKKKVPAASKSEELSRELD